MNLLLNNTASLIAMYYCTENSPHTAMHCRIAVWGLDCLSYSSVRFWNTSFMFTVAFFSISSRT